MERAELLPALFAGLAFAWCGCFGNEFTDFPPGLEPIEPKNKASAPKATARHRTPEAVETVTGVGIQDGEEYDWIHGRAYVHAPILRVYDAIRDPAVAADARQVDVWSVTFDAEEMDGVEHAFILHNTVDSIVSVDFDVEWRFGIVEGDSEEPELIAARYQKIYGTVLISILEGSLLVRPLGEEITEVEFIEHIQAAASSEEELINFVHDLFQDIVDFSDGRPLRDFSHL